MQGPNGMKKTQVKNQQRSVTETAILWAIVFIVLIVAYYFFVQKPKELESLNKQREITLRKEVYENCSKGFGESIETYGKLLLNKVASGELAEQKWKEELILYTSKRDQVVNNCVEKRLQEYKK